MSQCNATAEERKAAVATEDCVRCRARPGERCRAVKWNRYRGGPLEERPTPDVHVLRIYALRRTRKAAA